MQMVVEWAKLLNNIYQKMDAICPECGGEVQGTIYSNDNQVGFAILECDNCKKRVRLSRIAIPDNICVNKF